MTHTCPICGYGCLRGVPRSPNCGGSYEICPSCGFQFGVSDEDLGFSDEQWRTDWINAGMPWRSAGIEVPPNWNPVAQLESIQK